MAEGLDAGLEKGLEVEGMDMSQNPKNEGREQSLGSSCNISYDARVEKLLLGSKLDVARLKNEELKLTVMPKEVALKAMIETKLELEKRVESIETEKSFLLQMTEEMLQASRLKRSHQSEKKKTLINSVPKRFIGDRM